MDQSAASQSPAVQRLQLMDEEMPAHAEAVPLVTTMDMMESVFGWIPSRSALMRLLVAEPRFAAASRTALTPGGRAMLFAGWSERGIIKGPFGDKYVPDGPYRYTFASGQIDRPSFTPRSDPGSYLAFAESPDAQHVAIVQQWTIPESDTSVSALNTRLTISLARYDGTPPREILTLTGRTGGDADDLSIQWAPDGQTIALTTYSYTAAPTFTSTTRLLFINAIAGQQTGELLGHTLAGSVSFSPSGTRLLVNSDQEVLGICDLLTGKVDPIPLLPGRRRDPNTRGILRPLGFADDTRLLIASQRGKGMTILSTNLDGTDQHPLLRWSGAKYIYPLVAIMPNGYWH